MTTAFAQLTEVDTGTARVSVGDAQRITFKGEIGSREPERKIVEYVERVHEIAKQNGFSEVVVDIRQLSFVNSSNIRIFIDWVMNAKGDADAPAYRVRFVAKRAVTWQRLMLGALASLATDAVVVDFEDAPGATK